MTCVLQFLTLHFDKGASYSKLNTYRSAVSQVVDPNIATDFRMKRFFKGVFKSRPNLPKYNTTWDPNIVLNYVRGLTNEAISLELLTMKLAVLLALATGQRMQTLSLIKLCNIEKSMTNVVIKIPDRIKTSAPNRIQPTLILPFFTQDSKICVAKTMLFYIEKTRSLRNPDSQYLFITFKKPHHNASSQTISRWIKTILGKSGLDTKIFTAYSTRHAATSTAARRGVNLDIIRLSAGWTKESQVFAKFYKRPLAEINNFSEAVLGS